MELKKKIQINLFTDLFTDLFTETNSQTSKTILWLPKGKGGGGKDGLGLGWHIHTIVYEI